MSKTKVEVTNRYIEGLYYYFKVSSRDIPRSSAAGELIRLMEFRPSLFWDTEVDRIDPKKHARYIIERVLELGEPADVRSLFEEYPKDEIKRVMNLLRAQLSAKSKALWSLILP